MTQKQNIFEAMQSCVSDLDTADALFKDILDIMTSEQLDFLEDVITNGYAVENDNA